MGARGRYFVAAEVDRVDDGDDTVEMYPFVFARQFADLDCYWGGKGAAGGFYDDSGGIVFFCDQCLSEGGCM